MNGNCTKLLHQESLDAKPSFIVREWKMWKAFQKWTSRTPRGHLSPAFLVSKIYWDGISLSSYKFSASLTRFLSGVNIILQAHTHEIKSWKAQTCKGGRPCVSPTCLSSQLPECCHVQPQVASPTFGYFNVRIKCWGLINFNNCFVAHLHFPVWLIHTVENIPECWTHTNLLVLIKHSLILWDLFVPALDSQTRLHSPFHWGKLVKGNSCKATE